MVTVTGWGVVPKYIQLSSILKKKLVKSEMGVGRKEGKTRNMSELMVPGIQTPGFPYPFWMVKSNPCGRIDWMFTM